uniref:Uncharacterized protein n=1 Tax=Alexandrium monilatum TaxID=311494 RepID=A0A7S4VZ71_9DINO|mmetsp:Transcript_15751/g.47257  ORF Transcript_15751/g.47257 Transcript_15751/m.47257 type:complete len:748 (-) Transcript_15751:93-2336(-)|eukprot:CAMPEP_0175340646 /NCGR_PEP_ID=MMETSP0095-20121207/5941_1 /TAXON_ID=311494 /ORGANISM="Alexandrium monilatum, Strain CCMP3105" /LENGTH=747 /DNA_ID=CAMNT_0016638053 /DNA_START=48 /DNA_END=2291 /DNA_ORIENTATION=+
MQAPAVVQLECLGRRSGGKRQASDCPLILPEPLAGALKLQEATLADVPDTEGLAQWLLERGLSTEDWGKAAGTKAVGKYWKEIKEGESGLELWKTANGSVVPVRVTHVLRAKVCSAHSHERDMFLFNTWQQMADGQKRMRNGLLSEKLSTAEVPLTEHLHEVCERAVTCEEMQRVVESTFSLKRGAEAPEHDPHYACPIKVEYEHFVDYTAEVETSKSYPGLLTLYHLYTVEIICSGLPGFDFNTLEYDYPDKEGHRKLKYVHAWVWLDWGQIRRYLFEGSSLKERKTKGSFPNAQALRYWLSQFDLDLHEWGTDGLSSVEDLFEEVEQEEAQLELWGRDDGVPLLMRVVHVLQLKVLSSDKSLSGKFLLQTSHQGKDGRVRSVHRLMSAKLSSKEMPFAESHFIRAAEEAVKRELFHLMDAHFHLHPENQQFEASEITDSGVRIRSTKFVSHHFDVEESPSFRGMHTMYHLYGMEVECEKLPTTDFTSLAPLPRSGSRRPIVSGWRWVSWPETLDVLHARIKSLDRRNQAVRDALALQQGRCEGGRATIQGITDRLQFLEDEFTDVFSEEGFAALMDAQRLTQELLEEMHELHELAQVDSRDAGGSSIGTLLPPTMVSKMANDKITSEAFLEEAEQQRRRSFRRRPQVQRRSSGGLTPSEAASPLARSVITPIVEDSPNGRVEFPPMRFLDRRTGSAILAVCATQAVAGSLLLTARAGGSGQNWVLRALLSGAVGGAVAVAGVLLL